MSQEVKLGGFFSHGSILESDALGPFPFLIFINWHAIIYFITDHVRLRGPWRQLQELVSSLSRSSIQMNFQGGLQSISTVSRSVWHTMPASSRKTEEVAPPSPQPFSTPKAYGVKETAAAHPPATSYLVYQRYVLASNAIRFDDLRIIRQGSRNAHDVERKITCAVSQRPQSNLKTSRRRSLRPP